MVRRTLLTSSHMAAVKAPQEEQEIEKESAWHGTDVLKLTNQQLTWPSRGAPK